VSRLVVIAALAFSLPALAEAQGASSVQRAQPARPSPAAVGNTVPDNYVIGPEDVLGVMFWREPDMSGDVTVRSDGRITLPLIGDLQAAGETTDALKTQVQLAAQKYVTDANVTIVVRQTNSRKVFVTGEVAMPAAYQLTGPRTVMQVIAMAGGLTEFAKGANITILRTENGRTQSFKFNYKDVSKGRRLEQNIALVPGDTIVVP
jgi:polysaccharide export outer membrane protein